MTPARLDPEVVMVRLERIAARPWSRWSTSPSPPIATSSPPLPTLADAPPADYRRSFTDLADHGILDRDLAERLAACAGLRNVLVHLYLDIDVTTVARATQHTPANFTAYGDQLAAWLGGREPPASSE